MNHRIASSIAYAGSVTAAALAAPLMSGGACAEGPIEVLPPFVSTLSRAEVRAELMHQRGQATSYASEWALQQGESVSPMSGYTRAQARAEYIAARDQVYAMGGEDGGSSYVASARRHSDGINIAGAARR